MKHSLIVLSRQLGWKALEEKFGKLYSQGQGRPALPAQLMIGLHYLKYAFGYSDEAVGAMFMENPYWQYFCGLEYFSHDLPLDPSSMTRRRKRARKSGAGACLQETIQAALRAGAMKAGEVKRVSADATVQEKAAAYPTDARRLQQGSKTSGKSSEETGDYAAPARALRSRAPDEAGGESNRETESLFGPRALLNGTQHRMPFGTRKTVSSAYSAFTRSETQRQKQSLQSPRS